MTGLPENGGQASENRHAQGRAAGRPVASTTTSLEPNVTFTPDGKWIVFRSNMHGPTHVYAVEVARASEAAGAAGE